MKVLNLYAGIGGNRKLWTDVEVTAVEWNEKIAEAYQDFFPDDNMIVADAHQYLLEHYKEYDFIWSSPPCPTHSRARFWAWGNKNPAYPDMTLYQEIIFLEHHFKGKYCVENVKPYYKPLIEPQTLGRHCFWTNFIILEKKHQSTGNLVFNGTQQDWINKLGFDLTKYDFNNRKDQIYRNTVDPNIGKHILNCAKGNTQQTL